MFTVKFWKHAAERAVKTGCQFAVLACGFATIGPDQYVNALTVDWQMAGGSFLGGVVLSVATSVISEPFGDADTPSVVR